MQLDRTEIVIRQRSLAELMDLSLLVLRRHGLKIAAASAVLGIPLMIVNVLSLNWMLGEEAILATEDIEEAQIFLRWRHGFHLVALFVMQFPLASLPATVWLGNQVFYEQLSLRQLLSKLKRVVWPTLFILGILRLGLIGLILEFFVDHTVIFDPATEVIFILGLASVLLVRGVWPFAPEILGLELCSLRATATSPISYSKRRAGLHQTVSSDHLSRFIACSFIAVCLTCVLVAAGYMFFSTLTGRAGWYAWYNQLLLPLAIWLVGLFVVVFRFLSYLDSRIRLEGWELELRMRAEGERIANSMAPPAAEPLTNPEQVVA